MFENFDELTDETMKELQENETTEQDDVLENGNAEITPEEAESVGTAEYSPEARNHAWNEYNRLSDKEREAFLRGHSRNAHIMNMELRNERAGSTTGEGESAETTEDQESVGYSSNYYKHELATARNDIQRDYALKNYRAALARETVGSTTGEGEAAETTEEPETVGYYSSDYYERRMATALETGNRTMYNNARKDWAEAKVRESVGSTTGEGEEEKHDSAYYEQKLREAMQESNRNGHPHVQRTDWSKAKETAGSTTGEGEAAETGEEQESVGYSSDHYEHEMASALKNGNKIAYDNARANWARAKARESVGSTTGEGETVDETKEAVGSSPQFWLNKATTALAEGHTTAYKINMDRYYNALVKESVGYKAEDGSIIEGPNPNKRTGREK